jgi:glycosyltransferase involved in cell wall biosynthesis
MYPTPAAPAFGAFVQVQVEGLRALGCSVEVFEVHGQRQVRRYLKAIVPFGKAVRSFRADIVYAFYGLTGVLAMWQPVPFVLSLAGDDVLGSPNGRGGISVKSRLIIGLSHLAAARAAAVCVQSEEMRGRLWTQGLRARAQVVPYGVDPQRFHPGDQATARERIGFPAQGRIVLWPNTPTEIRKRMDRAEAVMQLVRQEVPDATMRIVSHVPHETMPDYYRAADCCLHTSDWEGSPNVVKEALLSGLPVVTTDVGDVRRWLASSPESAVCPSDPDALAREVIRVLCERKRVEPKAFLDGFSTATIAGRMLAMFQEVLSRKPGTVA